MLTADGVGQVNDGPIVGLMVLGTDSDFLVGMGWVSFGLVGGCDSDHGRFTLNPGIGWQNR